MFNRIQNFLSSCKYPIGFVIQVFTYWTTTGDKLDCAVIGPNKITETQSQKIRKTQIHVYPFSLEFISFHVYTLRRLSVRIMQNIVTHTHYANLCACFFHDKMCIFYLNILHRLEKCSVIEQIVSLHPKVQNDQFGQVLIVKLCGWVKESNEQSILTVKNKIVRFK